MHLDDVATLRLIGLTWDQIARNLTNAGARHKRGQAISPHQLRTEFQRLSKEPVEREPPSRVATVVRNDDLGLPYPSRQKPSEPVNLEYGHRRLNYIIGNRTKVKDLDE